MTTLWLLDQGSPRAQALARALTAWGLEVIVSLTPPPRADLLLAAPQDLAPGAHPDWVAMTQTPELPEGALMYVLASLEPEALAEALMLERQPRS